MSTAEELYRNSLVASTKLMSKEQFESIKFAFKASGEEGVNPIDLTFAKVDFKQVLGEAAEALLKMAASQKIVDESDKVARIALSLKYQVICD